MNTVDIEELNRKIEHLRQRMQQEPDNSDLPAELKVLYRQAEKWNALVKVLNSELEAIPDSDVQSKIVKLEELLEVYKEHLAVDIQFVRVCKELLRFDPLHREAVTNLKEIYGEAGRWNDLAGLLVSSVDIEESLEKKVELLHEAVTIYLDRQHNPSRAIAPLQKILELAPGDVVAFDSLMSICEKRRSWAQMVDAMERHASALQGEQKVQLLFEAAELVMARLSQTSDTHRAAAALQQILDIQPDNDEALDLMARVSEKLEDWKTNCSVLEKIALTTQDAEERVQLLLKLGTLYIERLDDTEHAAVVLKEVTALHPGHSKAAGMLQKIYLANEDWSDYEKLCRQTGTLHKVVESLEAAVETAQSVAGKKWLLLRCAEILDKELWETDNVLPYLERVLEVDPHDERAAVTMASHYVDRRDWKSFANVLETTIDLPQVIALIPDDKRSLDQLEETFISSGKWRALKVVLKKLLSLPNFQDNKWRAAAMRLGGVVEQYFDNKEEAVDIYSEILERFPSDKEAAAALERFLNDPALQIKAAKVLERFWMKQQNWQQLPKALCILIDTAKSSDERLLKQEALVDLYKNKLGQLGKAFKVLFEAVVQKVDNQALLKELLLMAELFKSTPELAHSLEQLCTPERLNGPLKIELARYLSKLFDTNFHDSQKAAKYHLLVLDEKPADPDAFSALAQFYSQSTQWDALVDIYLKVSTADIPMVKKKDLVLRACTIAENNLNDVSRLIAVYQRLLQFEYQNPEVLKKLENVYQKNHRWSQLYRFLEERLPYVFEDDFIEMRLRMGKIAQQHLNQPLLALENYKSVLEIDPDHQKATALVEALYNNPAVRPRAAGVLAQVYKSQGATDQLLKMLEVELESTVLGNDERAVALGDLAQIKDKEIGDHKGAFADYCEALVLKPADIKLRREVARLSKRLNLREKYADVLEMVLDGNQLDERLSAEILNELLDVIPYCTRDDSRTEKICRKVLQGNVRNDASLIKAVSELDRILSARGQREDLLLLLNEKVAVEKHSSGRKELLKQTAQITEYFPEQTEAAIALYTDALNLDCTDVEVFEGLERLYIKDDRGPELMDILKERVALEISPEIRRQLYQRVAHVGASMSFKKLDDSKRRFRKWYGN